MQPLRPGSIYHIFNHANGDDNIFRTEENYRFFLEKFKQHIYPVASVFAYNLLPNHFHWLLQIRREEELKHAFAKFNMLKKPEEQYQFVSKQFSNFFSSYTQSFNKVNDRMGSLFVKNFKRERIVSEVHFQNTFLYIYLNAVKHGFVENEMDWRWSSCSAYSKRGMKTLIDVEGAIRFFGSFENLHFRLNKRRKFFLNLNYE
ncbi:MAG: transposase [Chitinophagales bacterium]